MERHLPDFNDCWDYGDPAGTEAKFRGLLSSLEKKIDAAYRLQLLTAIVRALGRQKKFAEAHAILDEIAAAMNGGDVVEVRYLLERGRAYNWAGKPGLTYRAPMQPCHR